MSSSFARTIFTTLSPYARCGIVYFTVKFMRMNKVKPSSLLKDINSLHFRLVLFIPLIPKKYLNFKIIQNYYNLFYHIQPTKSEEKKMRTSTFLLLVIIFLTINVHYSIIEIQAIENSVEIYSPIQGLYPIGSDLCIKWSFVGYDENKSFKFDSLTLLFFNITAKVFVQLWRIPPDSNAKLVWSVSALLYLDNICFTVTSNWSENDTFYVNLTPKNYPKQEFRAVRGEPRTTPTEKNYPVETSRRMFKTAATSFSAMPIATTYTTTLLIMVISWQQPSTSKNSTSSEKHNATQRLAQFVQEDDSARYVIDSENVICRNPAFNTDFKIEAETGEKEVIGGTGKLSCVKLKELDKAEIFTEMQKLGFFCALAQDPKKNGIECRKI
ncbi:17017_t:CDS:2 [Cetraspora pellucida]|uniref:17017_t:CDS:1 n=1 Tax=Cetraspora pellucida TaxID=1433469 RepID=A0A9N9ESN1_9GLOM|nr:17017_t:CDS:2 [Cetraspora pellucida]